MADRLLTHATRIFGTGACLLGLAAGLWPLPSSAQTPQYQPLADIAAAAEDFARAQLADGEYAGVEVKASNLDPRLRLKNCELPLEGFATNATPRGGRTTVGVRCTGVSPWTLYVPVAVAAAINVVQIKGPLDAGTLLTEAHLEIVSRPLNGLPQNTLRSFDQVTGRVLTRAVNGETLATVNMLRTRELVAKGQEVVILAQGGQVEVRMNGVALEKGQMGERISVRNSNSGRTVQAVIVSDTTVQVSL